MAYCMGLDVTTCTCADTTSLYIVVVVVASYELINLVLVVGEVVCQLPTEVGSLDRTNSSSKLETGVVQRTDVAGQLVAEVATCRDKYCVDQVLGLAVVPVEVEHQTVAQEAQVETGVPGSGLLPGKVGIDCIRTIGCTVGECDVIVCVVNVWSVGSDVGIVADTFLLTSDTPTQTQFHVVDRLNILQEALFLHLPCKSYRWECTPLVAFREA